MGDTSELRSIREALSEVMVSEQIDNWLNTSNKAFGDRTPLEVIEDGDVAFIWQMIYLLRSGTPN